MFSSLWTPPKHKSSYQYENIDELQNISYIHKLPRNGNLNHHIIKQAIDFHGLSLVKKLSGSFIDESFKKIPIYEGLNLDYEGSEDDDEVNTEVLDFICEKAPWIFKTNGDRKVVGFYRLFQWKCYATLDRYNCLPPLEYFLKVGPDVCEQEFYKSVCAGDILFGKVIDHIGDSHILQIIATGGYHHRNLIGTNIKAELKWCDLDKKIHPDQKLVLSDDTGIEKIMWKINTLLTVEVLHNPNITERKIVTKETILVGTKGLVLEKLYYQYLEEKKFHLNKFPLGHSDVENSTNAYPSILKSIESKEVNSYDECLMKLKLNVNSNCKSIKTMCRCLDVHDKFCLSLMNSLHNTSHSWNEVNKLRQGQGEDWIKEVHKRKSLLENKNIVNALQEALKDVARYPNSANIIMSHIIFNKTHSRYKDALYNLKHLTRYDQEARKTTIFEIILEYAKERESTQNFRESEKLYKKCIEMEPDNEEANTAIQRLKEFDTEEGKDQDIEELEKLLELKEDLKKSVEKMSLLSVTTSVKELLQSGLLKLIDEEIQKYHCNICNIYVFGVNVHTHIHSKKHKTCINQLINKSSENQESLREDVQEGINTGLIKVLHKSKTGRNNYECTACKKMMNTIDVLMVHIETKKHEETVKRSNNKINLNEEEEKKLNEAMAAGDITCDSELNKYHCLPCEFHLVNKVSALAHILGKKHQANIKKKKVNDVMTPELQKLFDDGILTKKAPEFGSTEHIECTVCNLTASSISAMVSHLEGKRHKLNFKEKNSPKQKNPPKQEKNRPLRKAYTPGCIIYVSSIPSQATEADVINSISMFGRIKTARVRLNNNEALIEMCEEEEARDIVADQHMIKILEQAIEVKYSKHRKLEEQPESRVLLLYNLPYNEAITNNRSLIEMATPYGEVTGVKILDTYEREGSRKALLEMVDTAAATNLMSNFALDQKEGQNILVTYSQQKALRHCFRPASKRNFTGSSQGTYTGGNTEPLAHEITSDHQFTSPNELQRTYQPVSKRKFTGSSQGAFTGGNTEPLAHEIVSDYQFTSPNELQRTYQPASKRKFTGSPQGAFTGGNTEPLAHEIASDYQLTTQKRDLPPKKMSDKKLLQPDYLIDAVKDKLPKNTSNKKLLQPDYLINVMKGLPPKNAKDKKLLQPEYLSNVNKDFPPKKVYDYGHNKKNVFNTHPDPFPSNAPFSYPPSQLPSSAVGYNAPDFQNENIARNECNPSEYYKGASKSTEAVLPGFSKKRMGEHIQPKSTSQALSAKIAESLGLRSGTAAELQSIMSSMSAEQRKIWEERFGEQVKSIEQEVEEAFVKPVMSRDGHFSSDSEFEETRKRKQFEEDQEEINLLACDSKKTKKLLEEENAPDKSKFNVFARGLAIDRTKQEVHDFFSNYGVITDVLLEWCNNPTFVGEQSAYIAFKKAEDVTALLDQHQSFYIKDSLISVQMYTDTSESNVSIILVTGINYVYNDTKSELTNYFSMFGSVKAVLLNTTNRNSHYAFVVFYDKESAKEIVSTKEPYVFNKDTLKITEAKLLEKNLDKSEITHKIITVPADKFGPHMNRSVNILKDIMNETGATYEFDLHQISSRSQALIIHGTPEQIFSAKKLIYEKSGMQESNKLKEENIENDPPKILIITDHLYEVLEDICLSEADLELNTSVKILQNMTLPRLFNEVSIILNEMTNVKYVIFIFGIQDLTENVNTSKGFINVPKEDFAVMNEFLEKSQAVSDRLHKHFPGLKFFWTTPTPYNFEMYNRKKMSRNKNDSSHLLPTEYWKKLQGNFHKGLIHLRKMMLESDPHYTVDFLKLFLYSENSSQVLSDEQMLLEGEVSKENWFSRGYMKLNLQGGKALRYCIHKTVYRQVLWGSDSDGRMEWIKYVRAMLDSEQQERDHCNRNLKLQPLPIIEEVIRQQKF